MISESTKNFIDEVKGCLNSGKGGSGADEVARAAIEAHAGNSAVHLTEEQLNTAVSEHNADENAHSELFQGGKTVEKAAAYTLDNAVDYPLVDMRIYGKSMQDGTPSPENPVEIVSVESPTVTACGKNLFDLDYFLKSKFYDGFEVGKIENGFSVKTLIDTRGQIAWICVKLDGNFINGETYTISNNTNAYEKLRLQLRNKDGTNAGFPRGYKIVYDENYDLYITCSPFGGGDTPVTAGSIATFTNVQIELGNTATDYEPYKGSTASLTSALPLCGIPVTEDGNYTDSNGQQWICDELVYNADGSGKIVKRIGSYTISSNSDVSIIENTGEYRRFLILIPHKNMSMSALCTTYKYQSGFEFNTKDIDSYADCFALVNSTVRFVSNATTVDAFITANTGVKFTYPLAEPQEISLAAEEMSQLQSLQTFDGVTNISNDSGAEMQIKYCTNSALSEYVKPIKTGLQKQIDELKTAVLSLGGNV